MINFATVVQNVQNKTHKLFGRLSRSNSKEKEFEKDGGRDSRRGSECRESHKDHPSASVVPQIIETLSGDDQQPSTSICVSGTRRQPESAASKPMAIRVRRTSRISTDRRPGACEQKRSTSSMEQRKTKQNPLKPTKKISVARKMNKISIKGPAMTPRLRYTLEKQKEHKGENVRGFLSAF